MRLDLSFLTKLLGYSLLASIFVFIAGPAFDAYNDQVTLFPVQTTDQATHIPLHRTVYKISPETHTVLSWAPGVREVPEKLAKCSIRDRLNWRCMFPDGSGDLIMTNGKLQILQGANQPQDHIENAGRVRWWLLHLGLSR